MIQDLSDLHYIGQKNQQELEAIGYDSTKLTRMKELAVQGSELMGATFIDKKTNHPALVMRNRAYTYLKQIVDEIREAGKFVFWKEPDKLELYASEYFRKHRQSNVQEIDE